MLCSHFVHQPRACAKRSSLSLGQKLHAQIIKLGLHHYGPLPNSLLGMYGNSGAIGHAHQMFDEMPLRDPVSWASTLTAYNRADLPQRSLSIFPKMWEHDRLQPDHFVIASLVKGCASLGSVRLGKQVHAHFVRSPFYDDDVAKSSIVDMYSKRGFPDSARQVFNSIRVKSSISWTALISGYVRTGRKADALELFSRMPDKNLLSWSALISGLVLSGHGIDAFSIFMKMRKETDQAADPFILSSIIAACTNMAMLELGRQVHCLVIAFGFECNLVIANALVDMYAKCSNLLAAESIFTNMC